MSVAKVIEGMRQAIGSARCEHVIEALPHRRTSHDPSCVQINEHCLKCHTIFSFWVYDIPQA